MGQTGRQRPRVAGRGSAATHRMQGAAPLGAPFPYSPPGSTSLDPASGAANAMPQLRWANARAWRAGGGGCGRRRSAGGRPRVQNADRGASKEAEAARRRQAHCRPKQAAPVGVEEGDDGQDGGAGAHVQGVRQGHHHGMEIVAAVRVQHALQRACVPKEGKRQAFGTAAGGPCHAGPPPRRPSQRLACPPSRSAAALRRRAAPASAQARLGRAGRAAGVAQPARLLLALHLPLERCQAAHLE